ncbi:MerR family transcriptional regulator [Pseudobdellovibrio exovorus]|uniref:Transcriptional regulator n=1 Tax=Pseudobdellovibrio exovorus JSS TaxID=1184267 RepID=M4VR98_9BACT|nr:MerR family transcriptional regulator [Pseudobdellovibrio exovorus]AGH95704.1 transcriptional regulator [Pseudobdellovibrio exovorus JSS]
MTTNNPAPNPSNNADSDIELSLEDKFLTNIKASDSEEASENTEIKAEAASLPSVLVDEQLLQEMQSIPDRFGFKIGDVADLLGIKQYVLRYWEQEFDILKPKKASNNQRLYTKKDVENAFLIRKLLYRDKFSIEGARQALKDVKYAIKKEKDFNSVIQRIEFVQSQIKSFVDEIKKTKEMFN